MTDYANNVEARGNNLVGVDRILNKPKASVYRVGAATIGTGTLTAFTWDTIEYDSDGMWNPAAPTRLTCTTAGLYLFNASNSWASQATDFRRLYFLKTDTLAVTTIYDDNIVSSVTGASFGQSGSWQIPLLKNDYVEMIVQQTSGGNLAIVVATATVRSNGMTACLIST